MSSLQYIRDHYGVPAKRGGRIRYTGDGPTWVGTIVGARNARLRVRFDWPAPTLRDIVTLHPTWEVEYLEAQ